MTSPRAPPGVSPRERVGSGDETRGYKAYRRDPREQLLSFPDFSSAMSGTGTQQNEKGANHLQQPVVVDRLASLSLCLSLFLGRGTT